MSTLVGYVNNITETVTTIFEGMAITFSHFARRPMTIQYPDRIEKPVPETLPLRYRGILEVVWPASGSARLPASRSASR